MTPNSTDRIGAVSPLDSLLSLGHSPASLKAAQAFESLLNHATSATGTVSFRAPPTQARSSSDRNHSPSPSVQESRSEAARPVAPASKKEASGVIHGSNSRPDPREEERDRDADRDGAAPRGDAAATPPASTSPGAQADQAPSTEEQESATENADGDNPQSPGKPLVLDEAWAKLHPQAKEEAESQPEQDANATRVKSATTSDAVKETAASLEPIVQQEGLTTEGPDQDSAAQDSPPGSPAEIAVQTTQETSPEVAAVVDPVAVMDGGLAVVPEISATEQLGKSEEQKAGTDKSAKNENSQLMSPESIASAPTSPLDQSSTAAQDAAAAGVQAAVPPNSAPDPQAGNTSPPAGNAQGPSSRLPSHVLAQTEARRGRAAAPVVVDNARFLSRVAKAFLSAQQRGGEVRLRLSPPELGSLRLQVSVQDGVMVARLETETEAARASLTNNLPALRERLAEQGIRVERFDIDLMQRPSTGTPDRPSDPQQQHEPQPLRSLRTDQAKTEAPAPAAPGNHWSGQGRLNVII